MFKKTSLFLMLTFLSCLVRAEVTVQATVDRNEMGPGDVLTYTISVSSEGADVNVGSPRLPQLKSFQVINEWSSEEQRAVMQATPQGGRQFKTLRTQNSNFMLQPSGEGNLQIGSAEVEVDGKVYHTKPITIRVLKGASQPQAKSAQNGQRKARPGLPQIPGFPPGLIDEDEADLFAQLLQRQGIQAGPSGGFRSQPVNPNEAFFVQLETDKREAYVGEQVTASWYLYTRGQIRDLDTLKYPSLRGFWKEDIEVATALNFTDEVVNGVPYKKALLASYALFPIKEGTAVIDPYQAKCSVVLGDIFSGAKAYTFTRASESTKVKVKPLPTDGRPHDFSGAVGQFQVSARVEDQNIVTDQPFTYKIRFEGRGNAKTIDLPPFQVPEGMELFDTQKEAKFFRTGLSYKDFKLLLIPRREGTFVIPKTAVSIFDPVAQKYIQKETEPVTIVVHKGTGAGGEKALPLAVTSAPAAAGALPAIQTQWQNAKPLSYFEQLGLGLAALVLSFAVLIWKFQNERSLGQRKKDLSRQLKVRMRKAEEKAKVGDWRGVGVEITNTSNYILGEISGLGGANVEFEKLLAQSPPSLRRELGAQLTKTVEQFQILTFAPVEVVGALKDPAQLQKMLNDFEKLMEKAIALTAQDHYL
jgi:hypothetical protein